LNYVKRTEDKIKVSQEEAEFSVDKGVGGI
jgi:hypothetical protein